MFTTHFYSAQQITASIPASYIRSILQRKRQLVGKVDVSRGPSLNFFEAVEQRYILERIFECSVFKPTTTISAKQLVGENSEKRKGTVEGITERQEKRQKTCKCLDENCIHVAWTLELSRAVQLAMSVVSLTSIKLRIRIVEAHRLKFLFTLLHR
jgi:hypothetical protein